MKNVATLKEQGVDFKLESWLGLFAPLGTSTATVNRLNFHVNQVLAQPEIQEKFASNCTTITRGSSGDFANKIARDVDFWKIETSRLIK
jgi:tripartite-type tricarboxylate transporter receptor subunit TctC